MVAIVLLAGVVDSAPGQVQAGSKASGEALTKGSEKGFSSRPLRYIVPFPPGGSTAIVARIVAAGLTDGLGEQVVIDNRGGAAGTIGAEIAARAAPDGYTLFVCNIASLAVSPALYRKLGFDPVAGFEAISWQGLCTPAGVPQSVLTQICAALAAVLALPETRKRLADQGMQPTPLSPEKFAEFIRSERTKWAKLVKDVGIVPQ